MHEICSHNNFMSGALDDQTHANKLSKYAYCCEKQKYVKKKKKN